MSDADRATPARLIVIRGNSASGKSAVAAETRRYLDVPWAETLRRHATKPQAAEYGEREMRGWFRERDLLPGGLERVIPAASSLDETVRRIMTASGLGDGRAALGHA